MFDIELPPVAAPPEEIPDEVLDDLVEDQLGAAGPVRWSEYLPDGLLADMLAQPAQTSAEHREFEALERIGGWERVIAWAQARQLREIASFMRSAQARNAALGASSSQAYDSAVAEVGLMLRVSARTAAARVSDAWSLTTRLHGTLAALEAGRITLAKARILDAETLNLSDEHAAQVEAQVLGKARQQTPGQLRAAARRAVLVADPAAAERRAQQARRERGVRMWPEPDGMATVSAYLPAAEATGGTRCSMSTPATPDPPPTGAAWRPAAPMPWWIWCWAPPDSAARAVAPQAKTPPGRQPVRPVTWRRPPAQPTPRQLPPAPQGARDASAVAGWMSGSWFPTRRCSVPMSSQLSWPVTGRSLRRWPGTWPLGGPGGASSPIPPRADRWTTAPLVTDRPLILPNW